MTVGVLSGIFGGGYHVCSFHDVISVDNLFAAWKEFSKGKRSKKDVAQFELKLEDNIFQLHNELKTNAWKPHQYTQFFVTDPKLRSIHKASVRDRVLYQAIFRLLYSIFDRTFIHDSYSSRNGKGVHQGVNQCAGYVRKASKNYTKPAYVLKCDIKKFFDSIDHEVMHELIARKVVDSGLLNLIRVIIHSFSTKPGKGLPLGNVTSQLFANIYLNELDQYAKHILKAKYYIRYCDDFVIVHDSREYLEECIRKIEVFCVSKLALELHPRKREIRKAIQGIDFLGYVILPGRKIVRPKTAKRIMRKISELIKNKDVKSISSSLQSYLGILSHAKSGKLRHQIEGLIKLRGETSEGGNQM